MGEQPAVTVPTPNRSCSEQIPHSRVVACQLDRCIECYAVLDFPPNSADDNGFACQKARVYYVLAVPMMFQSKSGMASEKNYMFVCTCEKMRPVWETLQSGWQSSSISYEEWCKRSPLCKHAEELLRRNATYFSECLWELTELQMCRCIADVTLPEPATPISLIAETPLGLLISVALNRNNFPRNTVLCTNSKILQCLDCRGPARYSCQHCRFFSNWFSKDCNDPPLKQRLNGYSLREEALQSKYGGRVRTLAPPAWKHSISPVSPGQTCFTPSSVPLVKRLPEGASYPGIQGQDPMRKVDGLSRDAQNRAGSIMQDRDGMDLDKEGENLGGRSVNSAGGSMMMMKGVSPGNPALQKKCSWCMVEKAGSLFLSDKTQKDGLSPKCTACMRLLQQQTPTVDGMDNGAPKRAKKDAKKVLPNVFEKRCTKCSVVKPASGFYRDSKDETGLQQLCRACCLRQGPKSGGQRSLLRSQQRSLAYLQSPHMMMVTRQATQPMQAVSEGVPRLPVQSIQEVSYEPLRDHHHTPDTQYDTYQRGGMMTATPAIGGLPGMQPMTVNDQIERPRSVQVVRPDPYCRLRGVAPIMEDEIEPYRLNNAASTELRIARQRPPAWQGSFGMGYGRSVGLVTSNGVDPFVRSNTVGTVVSSFDMEVPRAMQPRFGEYEAPQANLMRGKRLTPMAVRDHEMFDLGMVDEAMFDTNDNPVDMNSFGIGAGLHERASLNGGLMGGAMIQSRAARPLTAQLQSSAGIIEHPRQDGLQSVVRGGLSSHLHPHQKLEIGRVMPEKEEKDGSFSFRIGNASGPHPTLDLRWSGCDNHDTDSIRSRGSGSGDRGIVAEGVSAVQGSLGVHGGLSQPQGDPALVQLPEYGNPVQKGGVVLHDQLHLGMSSELMRFSSQQPPSRPAVKRTGAQKRKPKVVRRIVVSDGPSARNVEMLASADCSQKWSDSDTTSRNVLHKRQRLTGNSPELNLNMASGFLPYTNKSPGLGPMECCQMCGTYKLSSDFASVGVCKNCANSSGGVKACLVCGQIKPLTFFSRDHRKPRRVKDSCSECVGSGRCLEEVPHSASPVASLSGLVDHTGELQGSSEDQLNDDNQIMAFLSNGNQVLEGAHVNEGNRSRASLRL